MKHWKFVAFSLFFCSTLYAAPVSWSASMAGGFSAQATFSSTEIHVPDLLTVDLELRYPGNYHVDRDVILASLLEHPAMTVAPFEVMSNKEEKKGSETIIEHLQFVLQANRMGVFPVTFSIDFVPEDSSLKKITIPAKSTSIHFFLPLFEGNPLLQLSQSPSITMTFDNAFNLFQNPERLKEEIARNRVTAKEHTLPWVDSIFLIFLALLLFVIKKKPEYFLLHHLTPEQQMARSKQEALKALKQLQQGHLSDEQLYTALTDTMRQYIERRYLLHASVQTSQEFLHEITVHPVFNTVTREQLVLFLRKADYVKFARYQPTDSERKEALEAAERFIKE